MRIALPLLLCIALAIPALAAQPADSPPARSAQAPPPPGKKPPKRPPTPQERQLACNVRQAQCADMCNHRFQGPARNDCYNRCNAEYVRCTKRASAPPAP